MRSPARPWPALLLSMTAPALASSAELNLPREGWVSWEVPAVQNAPFVCCWDSWDRRSARRAACELDGQENGYGSRDEAGVTESVRVYARFQAGQLERLQALAVACPVTTQTPVQELGAVPGDDSVRWLVAQVQQAGAGMSRREPLQEHALAALSMHRGALAGSELAELGRGHVRPGVRQKALFWLARAGHSGAEAAIDLAIRKDAVEEVREHAVFALSQLPGERATRALIATAEDRSLSREQRKRAVFWLSHSESDSAQAYLERVLARVSPSP